MSVSLQDVAMVAIRRLVERYKSAGLIPEQQNIPVEATNVHRQVPIGYSTDVAKGIDVLADDLIAKRVYRFAELPSSRPRCAVVAITDRDSGISLRVNLDLNGITFDAAGWSDLEAARKRDAAN